MLAENFVGSNYFGLKKVLVKEIVERKKLGQHFLPIYFWSTFFGGWKKDWINLFGFLGTLEGD